MNSDQWISVLNKLLVFGGSYLVSKGFSADQVNSLVTAGESVVGGLMVLGPIVYGWWKTSHVQQAATVAKTDGLKVVPTSDAGATILNAMPDKAKVANS